MMMTMMRPGVSNVAFLKDLFENLCYTGFSASPTLYFVQF